MDKRKTEEEILARFRKRDESALELFADYDSRRCYRIALGILEDAGEAEECVNDLCLRLWNSIPPERPASLRAYAGQPTSTGAVMRGNRNAPGDGWSAMS